MYAYRVILDIYNSRTEYAGCRAHVYVRGYDRDDAIKRIGTVYVSEDGLTVNNTGGVGERGRYYPEWTVVSVRSVLLIDGDRKWSVKW